MYKPLIVLSFICFSLNVTAQSRIVLDSEQGDFIGGGQNLDFSDGFNVVASSSAISIGHTSGFRFFFEAPNNRDIAVGAYLDAERAPFRGPFNPGLSVSSSGRGCNTISGEFFIYQLDLESEEPIIAIDFVQFCDSTTASLSGSIRINTDITIPFNQPFAVANATVFNALEGSEIVFDASNSISLTSSIEQVEWSHIGGLEIDLPDPTLNRLVTTLPEDVELGGETSTVRLTVTDAIGQESSTDIEINIVSKSDPKTFLTMSSEAGDFVGAGIDWFYDLSTADISASTNFDNGVSVRIDGSEFWNADFAAPSSAVLTEGIYDDAERFPFQPDGVAGLSISGDGRGCNRNFGQFEVETIERDSSGDIEAFRASFSQSCGSRTDPALTGTVSVNAKDKNVPKADSGDDIELLEGDIVNLNGSLSFDDIGQIVSYEWRANELEINNSDESRANFVAPPLADRALQQVIEISLIVTDDEGFKDADIVNVTVSQNNAPPTSIDDTVNLFVGQSVNATILENDLDNDGRLLLDTIQITLQPSMGNIVVNSDGTVDYMHTGTEAGADSFEYTVIDNDGAVSSPAVVTLQIEVEAVVPEPEPAEPENSGGGSLSYFWLVLLVLLKLHRVRSVSKRHN